MTVLLCVAIGVVVFFWGMHLIDRPAPTRPSVADITARLEGECHPRPHRAITIVEAHAILQQRRDCDLERCGEKWTAYWYLVDAGKLRPGREVVR